MASETKFTPGPWTANWSKYREGTFIVQAGAPSNRILAVFDGDGKGPDAEEIASAHLIAAAPFMADALAGLIGLCQLVRNHGELPPAAVAVLTDNHRMIAAYEALTAAGVEGFQPSDFDAHKSGVAAQ